MMKIEKMYNRTEFRVMCREHRAIFRCTGDNLHPIGNHWYGYTCPVCGEFHTVHFRNVSEMDIYDLDIDPDREDLPINRRKKSDRKTKEYIGRIRKLEKEVKRMKYKHSIKNE